MPLTILLTGFGPFPGAPVNPTGALVHALTRLRRPALHDARILSHIFPTTYRAVDTELPPLLAQIRPDAWLMFGLSGKAECLRVEMRARNAISPLTRDARGEFFSRGCIVPYGPHALFFDLPATRLALAASRVGVQAVVSRDAGRYLCNYLCWRAIESMIPPHGPKLAAFVHIPPPGKKGWRMTDLQRGAEAILLASAVEIRRRLKLTRPDAGFCHSSD